ncbi:MAG: PQQ-binding-like beta-propeller repeat protein, partial [Desulfobacterales bacterium]|nr:PQQ-binding-like beta-propeller repeat protein [Desulfobacterales bacterium]
ELKWRFETGGAVSSSPAIGGDGTIYVGSQDHHLYAIRSESPGYQARSPWPGFHFNHGRGNFQVSGGGFRSPVGESQGAVRP